MDEPPRDRPEPDGPASPERFRIARMGDLPPTACPCGEARRAFAGEGGGVASFHVVEIREDSRVHYHRKLTETYYVLEGSGEIELDGRRFPLEPGTAVQILPGCRHRAVGKLKIINVVVPPFDPADEWMD